MIAILDIDMGNLRSVFNAVDVMGYDAEIVAYDELSDKYTHLIIPGVGSFQYAVRDNDINAIKREVYDFYSSGRPILGICLGMQLLADWGEEGGGACGLSLIPGQVRKLPEGKDILLPHIGWNTVNIVKDHPVLRGIKKGIDCYFVHSYHFVCDNDKNIYGNSSYCIDFTSIIGYNNIIGVQFHPEKSQGNGLKLIENFCNWNGKC